MGVVCPKKPALARFNHSVLKFHRSVIFSLASYALITDNYHNSAVMGLALITGALSTVTVSGTPFAV